MPWCPKCRTEYREGFKTCNDCRVELVEDLGEVKPDLKETLKDIDSEEYLMTVDNDIQANIIEGLLNSNNIPVLKKYREAGDYLKVVMGSTNYGVDLFVPSSLLGMARRIVDESSRMEEQDINNTQETMEVEEINEGMGSKNKREIKTWMIFLIIVIPVLIWMYRAFTQ